MTQNLITASDDQHLTSLLQSNTNHATIAVLNFWASWAAPSLQMNNLFQDLAKLYPNLLCIQLEAENFSEALDKYNVESVPTFIFLKNNYPIHRLTGADPMELKKRMDQYATLSFSSSSSSSSTATTPSLSKDGSLNTTVTSSFSNPSMTSDSTSNTTDPSMSISNELKHLILTEPILLFMKGTPEQPKCGFSNRIVQLLRQYNVSFQTIDVLVNEDIRQGMKAYSNWPTFPQLYIKGEFIGGLDIVKELDESGELKSLLPLPKEDLTTKLTKLIHQASIMIFIKGTPMLPRCGFSNQLVSILNGLNVNYSYFDILTDEDVRQGLKKFSNWPTYPQVYINGELIGGLDIVKEMIQTNEFQSLVHPHLQK